MNKRGPLVFLTLLVTCGVVAIVTLFATGTIGKEKSSSNSSNENVDHPATTLSSNAEDSSTSQDNVIASPRLQYRSDPTNATLLTFHILQVTDIHLGEAPDTDWGPEQDRKTWSVLDAVINAETPDLIVLSGDQLTANNVDANATVYYQALADHLNRHNVPWAMTFGNHDDSDLERDGTTYPAKTSREELLRTHQQYRLSLSQRGPINVTGVSNYWLDVYLPDNQDDHGEKSVLGAKIVFFDSGGGSIETQVDQSQIQWFSETKPPHHHSQDSSPTDVPVVAFQHIPSTIEQFRYRDGQCSGLSEDDGVAPLTYDAGIVEVLRDAGNVQFLAVGHDHGNGYCCHHGNSTLHLCYGRHSGYGGYGGWDKGARVYRLLVDATSRQFLGWSSHVRLESGEIVDEYDPMQMSVKRI